VNGAWHRPVPWLALALAVLCTLLLACGGGARRNSVASPAAASATTVAAATPATAVVTPSAISATAGVTVTAAQASPAAENDTQAALTKALLNEGDLPGGYMRARVPASSALLPDASATALAVFARGSEAGTPGVDQIVVALAAYPDALAADSALGRAQEAVQRLTALPGSSVTAAPIPNGVAIGDATRTFRIAGAVAGVGLSGFAVYWRHGRVVAGVVRFDAANDVTLDDLDALARAQDAHLAAVGL